MDTPPALPPVPSNIAEIAGPLLIGYLLNWGLFGVLSMQIYVYYLAFPKDRIRHKALAYGVYFLEAANTFLLTQTAFHAFAEGFGNMHYLDEIGTIWLSTPLMSGIVAFVAQIFYAYRIFIISESKIISSSIVVLAVVQLGGAIANSAVTKAAVLGSRYLGPKAYITMGIWNGGSALCDVIIAICMTVSLSRRSTNLKTTQLIVRRIIRLTIETGTLTAVVATLSLILALLPGHPPYFQTATGILGKMYANSMLAVLNSRMKIAPSDDSSAFNDDRSIPVNSNRQLRTNDQSLPGENYPMQIGVTVTREQVIFPPSNTWVDGQGSDGDDKSLKV